MIGPPRARLDFDGDAKADLSLYRPSTGVWYLNRSATGFQAVQFGLPTDKIVPADYDNDGKTDIAVFRPATGRWFVFNSSNSTVSETTWGNSTDVVAPGDYDGDGLTDLAAFRPSDGTWHVKQSSDGGYLTKAWGMATDVPVPGEGEVPCLARLPGAAVVADVPLVEDVLLADPLGDDGNVRVSGDRLRRVHPPSARSRIVWRKNRSAASAARQGRCSCRLHAISRRTRVRV